MEGLELELVMTPTTAVLRDIYKLLDRVRRVTGHVALSEHKRIELIRASGGSRHSDSSEGGAASPGVPDQPGAPDQPAGAAGAVPYTGVLARMHGQTGLVGYAQICATLEPRQDVVELVTDPADVDTRIADAILEAVINEVITRGSSTLRLWMPKTSESDDARARAHGFHIERDLIQMRCRLPLSPQPTGSPSGPTIQTRPFRPGLDEEAWLTTNNRSFGAHPEQGHWDLATLLEREKEPWFDPDGFLLLEEDGRLAGSCWTKIHADAEPPIGEIYVIGLDPDFQGRGWGAALTLAGLDWLARAGLSAGMLYVDSHNVSALSMYRSMGFVEDHIDRAYLMYLDPT